MHWGQIKLPTFWLRSLIARFMWPTWGPSGADRIQVGPILGIWTLLSVVFSDAFSLYKRNLYSNITLPKCITEVHLIFVYLAKTWSRTDHIPLSELISGQSTNAICFCQALTSSGGYREYLNFCYVTNHIFLTTSPIPYASSCTTQSIIVLL